MKLNWNRIKALLDKEMIELWKNKIIVWTMIGIPLIMFLMTVGTMIAIMYLEGDKGDVKDFDKLNIAAEFKHLAPKIAMIVLLNEQYMFYYLMIPALLPVIIASHSIIGEKQIKSLEPLLATPITTSELLIGKKPCSGNNTGNCNMDCLWVNCSYKFIYSSARCPLLYGKTHLASGDWNFKSRYGSSRRINGYNNIFKGK